MLELERPDTVIETDPVRVQQVLKNLLSNACKFTSKGDVKLTVETAGQSVEFRVSDSGIGIPDGQRENIFEAFRQADGTTSRRFGGTGLGLTISRDLAIRLGGNITVSSQVGVGSVFTLTIPLRLATAPSESHFRKGGDVASLGLDEGQAAPHSDALTTPTSEKNPSWRPRLVGNALKGRRVLLAEDDVRNVYALTSVLEKEGIGVEVARNGKEALVKLRAMDRVDLVLMDIMMPEMNGIEATKAIRTAEQVWSTIPIIAITAKAMDDDRRACLEAGANDYVTKPLDVERLMSLMKIWLQRT